MRQLTDGSLVNLLVNRNNGVNGLVGVGLLLDDGLDVLVNLRRLQDRSEVITLGQHTAKSNED